MVSLIEATAEESGLEVLLWRRVPIGEYALGESAKSSMPDIRQAVFRRPQFLRDIPGPAADDAFERVLYLTRKKIEKRMPSVTGGRAPFYVPSMSHRTLVYKGEGGGVLRARGVGVGEGARSVYVWRVLS